MNLPGSLIWPNSATNDDLHELFSPAGQVQSARVITDEFSGKSKGFSFVEMTTAAEFDPCEATIPNSSVATVIETAVEYARKRQ